MIIPLDEIKYNQSGGILIMAKIKIDPKQREAIQEFIELYQPESVEDIYENLKDMLGETTPQMLETELEGQIGYHFYVSSRG